MKYTRQICLRKTLVYQIAIIVLNQKTVTKILYIFLVFLNTLKSLIAFLAVHLSGAVLSSEDIIHDAYS